MKTEPNSYDAAFAAAGLSQRMSDARLNTLTRVSLAACAVAEVEAEGLIPEGCYEEFLDKIAEGIRNPEWPAAPRPTTLSVAVRGILDVIRKGYEE